MKKKFVVTEVWTRQEIVSGENLEDVLGTYEPTGVKLDLSNWHAIEILGSNPKS